MSCGEYVCKNSDCGHVEFSNRMVSECPKCGADTAAFFDEDEREEPPEEEEEADG